MNNSGATEDRLGNAHVPLDELGRRLTQVLDLFKTRKRAAEIAERSVDMLAKYEKGAVEPPFSGLARLCLAAGVRMEWLATGEKPMLTGVEDAHRLIDDWNWGPPTKPPEQPERAPRKDFEAEPRAIEERDQRFLAAAIRIVDDRLHSFGLRSYTKPEEFAELVRIVLADLKRGSAEDAAATALDRVLNIARTPHQP